MMTTKRTVALQLSLLLAFAGSAHAIQTFTVNSSLDEPDADSSDGVCRSASGVCTLRAAVMQANVFASPSVVINVPTGFYPITRPADSTHPGNGGSITLSSPPDGSTPISIVGADAATTIVDGSQIDTVFTVADTRTAVFKNLTVQNGYVLELGGGILNSGSLTLDHVVVSGNFAVSGAGVFNHASGILQIVDSSIVRNIASGAGGGLYSMGNLNINATTIAANVAIEGGGLELLGRSILTNTTVAGNSVANYGGGVLVDLQNGSAANFYNSTIAFNAAASNGNNDGTGGGIFVNSLIGFNIYNTLIAGNYRINPAFADDCIGTIYTHAYNRFGSTSQCQITQISGAYTLLNSIQYLGALQDNGGPTQSVALLTGSNAIDGAAVNCLDINSSPIVTDQRGFPRNVGHCDIGAYEFGAADPNDIVFKNGFE